MAMDASSSPSLPSSSSTNTLSQAFSHKWSIKLDDCNFYSWKQKVEGVIRSHKLQKFVQDPHLIPEKFLTDVDRITENVNPAFSDWEQQDSLLFTWLFSTLSPSILPNVIQCVHSWHIWEEIHSFFNAKSRAQSTQLRNELKNITKGTKTASEFLQRIKTIVNTLASIGEPVTFRDHLEAIFDGLSEEYSALMTVIYNQTTYYTISEVEAMVISHEARFDRMRKKQLAETTPSVFLTQATAPSASSTTPAPPPQALWTQPAPAPPPPATQPPATAVAPSQPVDAAVDSGYGNRDDQNRNSGNYGRGRGRGRGRNVQCTYCNKWGHDAASCWSRPSGVSPHANSSTNSGQSGNFGQNYPAPGVNLGFSPMQFGGFPSMANFGFSPYASCNSVFPQYGSGAIQPSSMPQWPPWCCPQMPYPQVAGMQFACHWTPQGQFSAPSVPSPQFPRPPQQQVSTGMLPQAMLATVPTHNSSKIAWFPDSGATNHVTNNPGIFVDNIPSPAQD